MRTLLDSLLRSSLGLNEDELSRLFRFLAVGIMNTAFGYTIFAVAMISGFVYQVSVAISIVIGLCFNFLVGGRIVFGEAKASKFFRFLAVYIVTYTINILGLSLLIDFNINVYFANALLLPPLAILTFIMQLKLVYKKT